MSSRFSDANYEEAFSCDGSLRDTYVASISHHDWKKFLMLAGSEEYVLSFRINGVPAPIPSDVKGLFYPDAGLLLEIDVSGVKLNCHFFLENELELDLDPREVTSDEKAEAVVAFLSDLGRKLEKEVFMTAENQRAAVIFRYDPRTNEVNYIPPPRHISER